MRKNKKKGTSFVIVVFVTAILFTTATTMIAVVTNDYKTRINESKKVENLYESDSGLDIAYNVIVKNSDAAVLYATNQLSKANSGDALKDYSDEQINADYKKEFYDFLLPGGGKSNSAITKLDLSLNDRSDKPLIYGIANLQYILPPVDPVTNSEAKSYYANWETKAFDSISNDPNRTIKILSYDVTKNSGVITGIVVNLESTFKSDETKSTGFKNTKTIQTKFTITAPDYDKVVNRKKESLTVNSYSAQKAIVADGDLLVTGGNNTVNGDIWIMGTGPSYGTNPKYAYDKYKTGISINNATFNVTGDVSTYQTYNLINNAKSNITSASNKGGNLYALNAYVGPLKSGELSSGNQLNVEQSLVTNNDLAVNSENSNVTLNNYYGISDKYENEAASKEQASKESSSIIVNNNTSGSIVANTAYVHGVAYIDTNVKYQTGESVSVKENAVAYTERLPGKDQDVQIVNYDPLWLLEYKNGATVKAVEQKTNQFYDYFTQTQDIKDGGIKIAKLYSIGAGVNKSDVVNKNWSNENETTIKGQQSEYARNVFAMGKVIAANGLVTEQDYYGDNGKNMLTVGQADKNPQINFDAITQNFIENRIASNQYGKLVLNNNEGKDITISGTTINYDGTNYSMDNGSGQIEAVIITKGNVIIEGNVNFVGSIIAKGSVKINGDATNTKTITYNDQIVKYIIGQYATDAAKGVNKNHDFVNTIINNHLFKGEPLSVNVTGLNAGPSINPEQYVTLPSATQGIYDANKYLKKGVWKLLKEKGEVIDQK